MEAFIMQLWNMSIQAGIAVLIILMARLLFRLLKVPCKYTFALWAIPFIRLAFPWSVESIFSILPGQAHTIDSESIQRAVHYVQRIGASGSSPGRQDGAVGAVGAVGNSGYGDLTASGMMTSAFQILGMIWITGLALLLVYSFITYYKLRKRIVCCCHLSGNIYMADHIDTAFVLGIFKPAIYLPSRMQESEMEYVIAHEQTHIRRKDYLTKVIAFMITCVHWFNPFAWVAFVCMCRDMEMSCDEAVLNRLGRERRMEYASALLAMTEGRRIIYIPPAFGEGNTRGRIANIMKYKKPLITAGIFAAVVLLLLGVGLLTNPRSPLTIMEVGFGSAITSSEDINLVTLHKEEEIVSFPASYNKNFYEYLGAVEVERKPVDEERNKLTDIRVVLEQDSQNSVTMFLSADCSLVRVEAKGQASHTYRVGDSEGLLSFLDRQLESIAGIEGENMTDDGEIYVAPAEITAPLEMGADGTMLDYAGNGRIIYHGFYGLFVYSVSEKAVIRQLDLEAYGCQFTQGDNYCEVQVESDGSIVYLHPLSEKTLYIYDVEKDEVTSKAYNPDEAGGLEKLNGENGIELFDRLRVTQDCVSPDYTVFRSYHCVEFQENGATYYGYLESGSGLVNDLRYVEEAGQPQNGQQSVETTHTSNGENATESGLYAMSIKEGSLSAGGLKVTVYNNSDKDVIFGEDYCLKRQESGEYVDVPYILDSWGFHDIGYNIPKNKAASQEIDWRWLYGTLTPGRYQLIKDINVQQPDGSYEEISLEVFFEINDGAAAK